jgi:hypothetical protein
MIMHLKEIEMPACFIAINISYIQVLLNFINTPVKLHSGTIMTLVYILVYVLNSFN